jgi:DNA topoisomerase I
MATLIISEKPNAAKKIAEALADKKPKKLSEQGVPYYTLQHKGQEIIVGCTVGHLFSVTEKKKSFVYPSFDLAWKPIYEVDKHAGHTKKYLAVLKKLSKDAKHFVIACDFDTEGELIGLNILRFVCNQKDAERMKFSTLTKPDLKFSYDHRLKSIEWGQALAGETRHFLDWMYGINLSRALTLALKKAGVFKIMSSGRVQGPTLKLLVDKEREIAAFKPEPYWEIDLIGELHGKPIEATHIKGRFDKEQEAFHVQEKTKGKDGKVDSLETRESVVKPVTPFDLTTLQTESYSCLGISPKNTLSIAQNLYLKGLISYPRTSSQKLPKEINYKRILTSLSSSPEFKTIISKLPKSLTPFEGSKTDPAHPAIYPTGYKAKLEGQEKKVYDLIVHRFIACFGEDAVRENSTLLIVVNDERFKTTGARTIKSGWQEFYAPYLKFEDQHLPPAKQGDVVVNKDVVKFDKQTQPPRRFTEASIIKELEKRNLGTKSTRAQIVDALYQRNYITGKNIEATVIGLKTIETLEKYCPEIIDEELTRSIEEEMERIREKQSAEGKVIESAKEGLIQTLSHFKKNEKMIGSELKDSFIESMDNQNTLGICPKCGSKIKILYSKKLKRKFIGCENKECKTYFNYPAFALVKPTDKVCESCKYPIVQIIKAKKFQQLCINPLCANKVSEDKDVRKEIANVENGTVSKICPKCKGNLVVRKSIYGTFYGCSGFPKCRYTERIRENGNQQPPAAKNAEQKDNTTKQSADKTQPPVEQKHALPAIREKTAVSSGAKLHTVNKTTPKKTIHKESMKEKKK